jgi:hypothetical protein
MLQGIVSAARKSNVASNTAKATTVVEEIEVVVPEREDEEDVDLGRTGGHQNKKIPKKK